MKEHAEAILSVFRISASNVINMFYRQIILHKGLPLEVKLSASPSVDVSTLTAENIDQEHQDI